MGKKNATNAPYNSVPVEQYRKQIGKENWKHNKKDMKESKKHADARSLAKGWQSEAVLMLLSFCVLLAAIYALFYFYLAPPQGNVAK